MPLTLVTWNVENLNHAKSLDGATQAAFQLLGTLADILVVQELTPNLDDAVLSVGAIITVLQLSDANWNGIYTVVNAPYAAAGAMSPAAERYAVFWRHTNVPTLTLNRANSDFPAICNQAANFAGSPFAVRNPFLFTFTYTLAGVVHTLRVLTHHAPTVPAQITADLAALNVAELSTSLTPGLPVHSVVCGDFNTGFDLAAAAFAPLLLAGFAQTVTTSTSLNGCLPSWSAMYLSQPYDRILYRNLAPVAGGPGVAFGVIDFVAGLIAGAAHPWFIAGFAFAPPFISDALWQVSHISDHLPAFATFA